MGRIGHRITAAAAAAAIWLLSLPALAAAQGPDYTWTGAGSTPSWSDPGNWQGGAAPASPAGIITFPSLGSSAGYQSENDLSGLSADGLQVDDGDGYVLSGDGLALGSSGLSAAPPAGGSGADAFLGLPLSLTVSQTWSVAGPGGLDLLGGVSGAGDDLAVSLSSGGALRVGSALGVGQLSVSGPGTLELQPGSSIAGSLTTQDIRLTVGQGAVPDAAPTVGALTLDPQSSTTLFVDQDGDTPGTDHSQITADGPVTLDGSLALVAGVDGSGECASLTPGDTLTLIQATGGLLTGTFANAPNGAVIPLGSVCSGSDQQAQIEYGATSVTATIVAPSSSPTTTTTTVTASTPAPAPPVAQPQPASTAAVASAASLGAHGIGADQATVYGSVGTGGASVQWQFRYGRDSSYGKATPLRSIPAGSGTVPVQATLRGLTPLSGYHYQLVVYEPIVTAAFPTTEIFDGLDRTFETAADGRLQLSARNLGVQAGRVLIPQRCRSTAPCTGRAWVTARVRRHGRERTLTCATSTLRIRPGRRAVLALRLSQACRSALASAPQHRLPAMFASKPLAQLGVSTPVTLIG